MFIHRLTFLNNSESSPTKASTAYLIPHLGFIIQRLYSLRRPTWDAEHELCRSPLLSSLPLQASPLALLSSHSLSQQSYPTGQRGLLITAVISPLATLHSPLSLSRSLSLCFIGMTNNATFVYPKQRQVSWAAHGNIKKKRWAGMKYTCNNGIGNNITFC